jgi:dolichyl-phosphate beta-glucosyltransferase
MKPEFSLVFPVYNAGAQLDAILCHVRDFLARSWDDWEAIFVCDGCTDGSAERIRKSIRPYSQRLRLVAYQPNKGKGHAVRAGLVHARGKWIVFTDVDLAYSWNDITTVAHLLKEGHQVVTGSRALPESRVTMPLGQQAHWWRRAIQGRLFVALAHRLLPFRQRDPQAGLKGMCASVAHRLVPQMRCDGFAFDCELLTACHHLKISVTEIPVHVSYQDCASTTSLGGSLRMVRDLYMIRRNWQAVMSRNRGEEHEHSKHPTSVRAAQPPGNHQRGSVDRRPAGVLHSDIV